MGFFKKIFRKKEGGTFVGNLLRGAGDHLTGGLVSKVFKVPTSSDKSAPVEVPKKGGAGETKGNFMEKLKAWFKTSTAWYIVGGVVALGVSVWVWLSRGKSKKGRRR